MNKNKNGHDSLLKRLIIEGINSSESKMMSQKSIIRYIKAVYKDENNDGVLYALQAKIRKILRESKKFTKSAKLKNEYLWSVAKNIENENPICKPLKHIGKYINLPLIKCKKTYENKTVVYNSLYHTISNSKIVRRKYNFNINNIYDYNRTTGDHLRMYFSINKTYYIVKTSLLEDIDVKNKFTDLLEDLQISNNFVWNDVDYEYVNDVIYKFCTSHSNIDSKKNKNAMEKYNMDNSLFEKIDIFESIASSTTDESQINTLANKKTE